MNAAEHDPSQPHLLSVVHAVPTTTAELGGMARMIPALCSALAGAAVSVRFVTLNLDAAFEPNILPRDPRVGVNCVDGWASKPLRMMFSRSLRPTLVRELQETNLLHSHGVWQPVNHDMAVAAKRTGRPHILSPHGMLQGGALRYKQLKKKLAWWIYQAKDLKEVRAFHAASPAEAQALRELGLDQPIAVIPVGVDLPPAQPRPYGTRRALFLSRVNPTKGPLILLRAWHRAKSVSRNWRLTIAGNDENDHLQEVRKLAEQLGLEVDFPGLVADDAKWSLYRSADLFVLPTLTENFGIVIAEALASGVPVVTTKGAPWPEIVQHRCGWWTEVDEDAFATALQAALETPAETLAEMGARGQALVQDRFSWPRVAEKMKGFYQWILHGGPAPEWVQT
ncbi:MAG: glycosyltransferase [Planctomycetes bacterium]|nr:glycosyltransferase [Planctomycetota bacterium]